MSLDSQIEDQPQLAEDLWLLRTLRFIKPGIDLPELSRDAYQRLVLSDAIALYLTTDERDGLVVAFYMPEDNVLFLAKSGSSDPSYRDESTLFFNILTSANGFEDLLPFLARRGCNRINKRIRKLRASFNLLYDDLLEEAGQYEPTEAEFHGQWCRMFIQLIQAEFQPDTLHPKDILTRVLTFLKDRLENNPEFSNKSESHRPFAELLYAVSTFYNTRFLRSRKRTKALNILGYFVEKLVFYLDVSRLIKVWQRYGRDTCIKWITDIEPSRVPRTLTTAGVGERHLEAVYQQKVKQDEANDYKPYLVRIMNRSYPGWEGKVGEGMTVVPCMHAEISLILYLMGSVQKLRSQVDVPLPIGSGQRTCFACSLWMEEFNRLLKMKWTTSRYGGRPRYDWVLPSANTIAPYVGIEGHHRITSHVHRSVTDAIERVFRVALVDAVDALLDERCMKIFASY